MKITLNRFALAVALAFVPVAGFAQMVMGGACGDLRPPGQYGPFDYRTITSEVRHRVEDYHFTAEVQSMRKGASSNQAAADVDYTLRAFPNNPRALLTMSRLGERAKSERPPGSRYTVECYFQRALDFVPDDPMPRVLYANYLIERHRAPDARKQLAEAERLRGNPLTFDFDYNLGLMYADLGDFDKASVAAERAYKLGAQLPALRNKLKAAGKWREPVDTK